MKPFEELETMPTLCKDVVFESERLLFRGIASADADMLIKWRSQEDVYKYTPNPKPITRTEHEAWFVNYMKNEKALRTIFSNKTSKNDIGMVGGELEDKAFVLSYYVGEPEYRGKGYASEAIKKLMDFLRGISYASIFRANVHKYNEPSIFCLKKIGFSEINEENCNIVFEHRG